MIVMSPSNILAHMKCPLRAWGQREKLIVWKETPQKRRGLDIHETMEKCVKESFKAPILPEGVDVLYVADIMTKLKRLATEHKLTVLAEQDLAVTKSFTKTDFFADDVFFRAKADLLMYKPNEFAVIGDWKTGKIYDYSKDQMRLEALLVSALYNIKIIHWRLFYVDQGKTVQGLVNLSQGLGCVKDLTDVMHEMQQLSASNGPWLAKKNKFCKWCDWYHRDECKESEAW